MYTTNSNLKEGDILLLKNKSLVSLPIQIATLGKFTHAAIYVGNGMFIEAINSGVQFLSAYRVKIKSTNDIDVLRIKDESKSNIGKKAAENALKYQGHFYSLLSAILSTTIGKDPKLHGGAFCSQLVAQAYAEVEPELFNKPSFFVSPNDLARLAEDGAALHSVKSKVVSSSTTYSFKDFQTENNTIQNLKDKQTQKYTSIIRGVNKVYKKYGLDTCPNFPQVILLLVDYYSKDSKLGEKLDESILAILKKENLSEFFSDTDSLDNSFSEFSNDIVNGCTDLNSTRGNIQNLSHIISHRTKINNEYLQMKDVLYQFFAISESHSIFEILIHYNDLQSIHLKGIQRNKSALEEMIKIEKDYLKK